MLQWRLDPLSTKISFEKSNFLIFCAFLRYLHVYDFFINVLLNWAVRKRIYRIFGFNAITKTHFWFFLQSFNFNFDICTSVGSWLDKLTHLLLVYMPIQFVYYQYKFWIWNVRIIKSIRRFHWIYIKINHSINQ